MKKINITFLLLFGFTVTQIHNSYCAAMLYTEQENEMAEKLVTAAISGDLDKVKELLENGVDVNAKDETGDTALIVALSNRHNDIVNFLLGYKQDDPAKRVNVNLSDSNGTTPLMEACVFGNLESVNMLLNYRQEDPESRVNVNAKDSLGRTALMHACSSNVTDPEVVKVLLNYRKDDPANRVDVNAADNEGKTALMLAIPKGGADIFRLLLDYQDDHGNGIDVNAVDRRGHTALFYATNSGYFGFVKMLIDSNRVKGARQLQSALDSAVLLATGARSQGDYQKMIYLLKEKLNWQKQIEQFIQAALDGDLDTVKALLESGVDVNATDSSGDTALIKASEHNHSRVVEALIDSGKIEGVEQLKKALEKAKHTDNKVIVDMLEPFIEYKEEGHVKGA